MSPALAFLAAFAVQIFVMSVLLPAWCIRYLRVKIPGIATARFEQLHPAVDPAALVTRIRSRLRIASVVIVVIGLLLMAWFVRYTNRPDWDDGPVEALLTAYFMLQAAPICLLSWLHLRLRRNILERTEPAHRRSATLQRRGLFQFVSPALVAAALLAYAGFAALVLYIERDPFPGFAGAGVNLALMTLLYALQAAIVYWILYGRKINRAETDANGLRAMSLAVRVCVLACIVSVASLSLNFTLVLYDLQRWEPFVQSLSLLLTAALVFQVCTGQSPDRFSGSGSSPPPAPRPPA